MNRKKDAQPLSPKQRRFVCEYLIDRNATQSAIKAGYSKKSAYSMGSTLLKNPKVREAIEAGIKDQEKRTQITADRVLAELARVALVDLRQAYDENGQLKPIHDLPEDLARAVAGVDVDELFEFENSKRVWTGYTKKLRMYDKVRALVAIGNHLRMFPQQHEVTGKNGTPLVPQAKLDLSKLSDDDLRKLANMKIEGSDTDLSS